MTKMCFQVIRITSNEVNGPIAFKHWTVQYHKICDILIILQLFKTIWAAVLQQTIWSTLQSSIKPSYTEMQINSQWLPIYKAILSKCSQGFSEQNIKRIIFFPLNNLTVLRGKINNQFTRCSESLNLCFQYLLKLKTEVLKNSLRNKLLTRK